MTLSKPYLPPRYYFHTWFAPSKLRWARAVQSSCRGVEEGAAQEPPLLQNTSGDQSQTVPRTVNLGHAGSLLCPLLEPKARGYKLCDVVAFDVSWARWLLARDWATCLAMANVASWAGTGLWSCRLLWWLHPLLFGAPLSPPPAFCWAVAVCWEQVKNIHFFHCKEPTKGPGFLSSSGCPKCLQQKYMWICKGWSESLPRWKIKDDLPPPGWPSLCKDWKILFAPENVF